MLQGFAAARPRSIDRDNGCGPPDPAEQAAISLAALFARTIGADGALVALEPAMGEALVLGLSAGLSPTDVPPPAPFLLAVNDGELRPAWRPAENGLWLIVSVRMPADGGTISLNARFQQQPATDLGPALSLVSPSLHAFASAFSLQREAAKRVASYESALDRSELGILLLGCDGALLFANRSAERLLAAGDMLRHKGNGIAARDLGDAVRLQVAIEHVCAGDEDGVVEDTVVALKRRHPLRPLLVCVSPARQKQESACDAGAILRIIDPDRDLEPFLMPVCAHYRLSPVETRLACRIAAGVTVETAAASLRIKQQTARSYLKQIFLKTDTNRQSDLVRLLLSSIVRAVPAGRFRVV